MAWCSDANGKRKKRRAFKNMLSTSGGLRPDPPILLSKQIHFHYTNIAASRVIKSEWKTSSLLQALTIQSNLLQLNLSFYLICHAQTLISVCTQPSAQGRRQPKMSRGGRGTNRLTSEGDVIFLANVIYVTLTRCNVKNLQSLRTVRFENNKFPEN